MATSPDFTGRRLPLANTFRDWATAQEAADNLGTETGSVFGLIKRMHGEGILEADTDPAPPTRGTQYRLTPDAKVALDQVLQQQRKQEPGVLELDQRILLISGGNQTGLDQALSDPALSSELAWIAWVGPSWLIAMAPGSGAHALRRLTAVLEASGFTCQRGLVDDLRDGSSARSQASTALDFARTLR